jgi:Transcriptional regulators
MDHTRERPATLAEIARRAGTTVPTVSKVLNGRSDVSTATRERVMRLVDETGYRRRERRSRRPGDGAAVGGGLVDLVISGVEGSWANHALSGVEHAAAAAGLDVVVTVARDAGDWVARLLARRSSGAVIALVAPTAGQLATLSAAGIRAVLLDPTTEPPIGIPSVGAANWAGGHAAGEHLLSLGHTRFAVVGGQPDHLYSQARIDGFRSALQRARVPLGADRIVFGGWRRHAAAEAVVPLLAGDAPPTAIFACSDAMALGVYEAAAEAGISIPGRLSVVGFDDLPEARWVTPALTTVRQPVSEMAASALRMLLRLRSGDGSASHREELATSLVLRTSTAPPESLAQSDA